MVISFGCNVPGIYATRILHNKYDRFKVAMMAPFMSCSARLTVYALICSAFFVDHTTIIVFSLYVLGVLVAILLALLLKLKNPQYSHGLVLELPRYQFPKISILFEKTKNRLKSFCFGAGKSIVIVFIVVQMLFSVNSDLSFTNGYSEKSVLVEAGKVVTPIFEPMGLKDTDWPLVVSMITGVVAKEVVVGTLSAIYNADNIYDATHKKDFIAVLEEFDNAWYALVDNFKSFNLFDFSEVYEFQFAEDDQLSMARGKNLVKKMSASISNINAVFAYLVFILLYFPCISVYGAIKQEIGHKAAITSAVGSTVFAYVFAVLIYQILQALL
jgi:ferrous iron transport protein B